MKRPAPFLYATLVWFTGLLGMPFTAALASSIVDLLESERFGNSISYESWEWFGMMALSYGMVLFPSWLVFIWMVHLICKRNAWGRNKRLVLFGAFSLLAVVNFIVFRYFILLFWFPGMLGVFFYRLPKTNQGADELNREI